MTTDKITVLVKDSGQLALRWAIAISFLRAVVDRLGILGGPGTPGVSWGSWNAFRDYTAKLVPASVDLFVDIAAIAATALETVIAIFLIVGFSVRLAALAAAGLTLTFGLSMFVFLEPLAPFRYPVFVFTAAALLLAGLSCYRWSVDAGSKSSALSDA